MENRISKYELLFIKEIEGSLSVSEQIELKEWLQDPENKVVYEEQKELWISMDDLQTMKTIDKRKAFKKVEARLFGRFSIALLKKLERVASILFIPLLFSALGMLFNLSLFDGPDSKVISNTIEVPSGTRSSFTLPDGTFVRLNAGSSLTYPVSFSDRERQVELNGEAWFEVTKDKRRPFIVSASEINIQVLGTSFNCSAYDNDSRIETALVEGTLEISAKDGKNKLLVNQGELAVFSKQGKTIVKTKTNLDKYTAWKSGRLTFRDDPMSEVIEKLGRWYSVQFQVEDPEILTYTYSATFSGESLDQVLKMLALSAPIRFNVLPRERVVDKGYGVQIVTLTKD